MSKTIIVSNRLPLKINIEKQTVKFTPSIGGLATGLQSFHKENNSLWIGWTGLTDEEIPRNHLQDDVIAAAINKKCIPIPLSQKELEEYYEGFSNRTLWPLFHYFNEYVHFETHTWEWYKRVNRKFADEIAEHSDSGDIVWVHDYQLMLVPAYLREKNPGLTIGFFLHIPFPSFEVFRTLPFREELLEGVLGADLIGFHTFDYECHFLNTVNALLPARVTGNTVLHNGATSLVGAFPMGIDVQKFEAAAKKRQTEDLKKARDFQQELELCKKENPEVTLVLSIDRLDYTKGIANRIKAFDYFLQHNPQYQEKVRLIMLAVPSRTEVPQYQLLKKEIDELVGRINGKYATLGWAPIWYFYRSFPFKNLIDLYTSCDIALLTPLRDGMNLVAKEYVCSRVNKTGVLILSEMAGAAKEMNEALLINPNSFEEISTALKTALNMPFEEQTRRMELLQNRLKKHTIHHWAKDFMDTLKNITKPRKNKQAQKLDKNIIKKICTKYRLSNHRKFFLDYDGTLVDFKEKPEDAIPDKELLDTLRELSSNSKNDVVIVSGRDRTTLEKWMEHLPVSLIAEHGICIRNGFLKWEDQQGLKKDFMNQLKPVLETYTERTPGSFIEEKKYSLAWHYRKADTLLGKKNAKELIVLLKELTDSNEVKVLDGRKVVEIIQGHINKGIAVNDYLEKYNGDFIFAIGDDQTDEYVFKKLAGKAITIKVGTAKTAAAYYVDDYREARQLLNLFVTDMNPLKEIKKSKKKNIQKKAMKTKKIKSETSRKRIQAGQLSELKGFFEETPDPLEVDDPLMSLEEKWLLIKEPFRKKYHISSE